MTGRFLTLFFIPLILTLSCNGDIMDSEKTLPSLNDISDSVWKELAQKKIYFGHQSVGYNIISGIKDILTESPKIHLNVVELPPGSWLDSPQFAHSTIGTNKDPRSKCKGFAKLMDNNAQEPIDIAFFKFCYIDFNSTTKVEHIFEQYKVTFDNLKERFPKTIFIHVTVPLTVMQTGPKAWIKSLMGRPLSGYEDNIKRCLYNRLLRTEYQSREPIFDLAGIESTFPNGKKAVFKKKGQIYNRLVPEYTYDGGHFNKKGRIIVAEQLLIFLTTTL